MTKTSNRHTLVANYKTLAGLIAQALRRNEGMTVNEVRTLAALSMTVSSNLAALIDEIEPRVHLAYPISRSEFHTACGIFTGRIVDDRELVTCKTCQRTKVFNEAPDPA